MRRGANERRGRGQALVEFAVSIPLFLLILLCLIDFGRLLFTYASLVNASSEMARALSIPANSNASIIAAFNNLNVILGPSSSGNVVMHVFGPANQTSTPDAVSNPDPCSLPLSTTSCTAPTRTNSSAPPVWDYGHVDVNLSYTFQFLPFRMAAFGINLPMPDMALTYTARELIE